MVQDTEINFVSDKKTTSYLPMNACMHASSHSTCIYWKTHTLKQNYKQNKTM